MIFLAWSNCNVWYFTSNIDQATYDFNVVMHNLCDEEGTIHEQRLVSLHIKRKGCWLKYAIQGRMIYPKEQSGWISPHMLCTVKGRRGRTSFLGLYSKHHRTCHLLAKPWCLGISIVMNCIKKETYLFW
jgi:hypothetical protein